MLCQTLVQILEVYKCNSNNFHDAFVSDGGPDKEVSIEMEN